MIGLMGEIDTLCSVVRSADTVSGWGEVECETTLLC